MHKLYHLHEEFLQVGTYRVDRDKGIIYGVKILGESSVNGLDGDSRVQRRVYSQEALRRAAPMYEGVYCSVDHPERANQQDSAYDKFGQFHNVVIKEDGLYADLHYLRSHPLADRVVESCERMPGAYGFSHRADARGEVKGSTYFVQEIVAVQSVDLVSRPATTNGIFESRKGRNRMSAKELNEEIGYSTKATEGEEEGGWRSHLGEMVKAMCEDEGMDHETMVAKVKHALGTLKKGEKDPEETEEGEDLEKDAEADGDSEGSGPPKGKSAKNETTKEAVQSLRNSTDPAVRTLLERVDKLETKARIQSKLSRAHKLCESAGLPKEAITEVFLDTLVRAPDADAMKQLVEDRRALVVSKKPRSFGGGKATMDAAAFAKALRNGN